MRKVELLAPAGDQESLIAAIQNGANAIYLGGSLFSARAYAKNFNNEQLLWAIQYAHLRDVKIYVTVNILYKDDEFDELIKYIDFLYDIQIDALIIQDLGLFYVVKNRYNDFEIHMSTQASVMNLQAAKYFEENGAHRVVLARENTLEEIKEITNNTQIEVEVFVHGALCVCYSGQCLMSSMIGKRSGNRGQCAQPCRLEYRLKKDNEIIDKKPSFLLSPKDLMTIDHIGELIEAGVTSFKIEGRMKRPEYVASVVKAYRKAIDNYLNDHHESLSQEKDDMKQMFNRDYTNGYLFFDKYIVDSQFSGNRGIVIGKVVGYNKHQKRVIIELSETLKQGDSILFEKIDKGRPVNKMYYHNKLVNQAHKNDRIEIEFDYFVKNGNVRKIIDQEVIKRLQQTYQKEYRKSGIDMDFVGHLHDHPILKVKYKDICITKESSLICEKALKTPIDQERIKKQLSKLGNTPFVLEKCQIDIDHCISIPIKEVNDLRREAINELSHCIENQKVHNGMIHDISIKHHQIKKQNYQFDVYASSLTQVKEIVQYPIRAIYYPFQSDVMEAYRLCQKNKKEMILFIPRIVKTKELEEIKNSKVYQLVNKIVVNEMGAYHYFNDKEKILGTGCNIYNSYAVAHFDNECILSLEMSTAQINQFDYDHKIVQVYGKIENMISEFCPISQHYYHKQVKNCQKCKNAQYSLVDRKNESFDLMMDEHCRMHLLNNHPLYIDDLNQLKTYVFLIHLTNEDEIETRKILDDYLKYIINHQKSVHKADIHYTLSYFQ